MLQQSILCMQGTQYATKRSILCRGAFCGPTVRLLVHRFIFSMLLGKYSRYICCRWKYSSKFCLFGNKMIWCLALNSKIDVLLVHVYSLRYTCVFEIHVRTYFKQSIWTNKIHLQ